MEFDWVWIWTFAAFISFFSMGVNAAWSAFKKKRCDLPSTTLALWTTGCVFSILMFAQPWFEPNIGWNEAERLFSLLPLTFFGTQLASLVVCLRYKPNDKD